MRTRILAFAITIVSLAVTTAAAQPSSDAEKEGAKHYKQGRAFYDAGVYDKALDEFYAAYDIAPKPLLLYHMARSNLGLGQKEKALVLFQQFVAQDPSNKAADDARAQIAVLTKELATKPPPPIESKPPEPPIEAKPPPPEPQPLPEPPPPPIDHPSHHGHHRTKWMIAAGLVAIAAGVALDTLPSSSHDGQLGALDFAPAGLYVAGVGGITFGWFK